MERCSGESRSAVFNELNQLNISFSAIDRVHRIGQDKTVYVTHFIVIYLLFYLSTVIDLIQVRHTIEKRILKIQKRKTAIVNEAFRGSGKADPESIQNLKIMFGDDWDE